jgi:hypothetical protein
VRAYASDADGPNCGVDGVASGRGGLGGQKSLGKERVKLFGSVDTVERKYAGASRGAPSD